MVAALGTTSAFAQSGYWAGVNSGWPAAQVHFCVENVFAGLDVRGNLGFAYFGGYLEVGASVLYDLGLDTGAFPLDVYVGCDPGFASSLEAFANAGYRLSDLGLPEAGVFLELGPSIVITPTSAFVPAGRLGFNWHF